jgi:hypothetical protein
VAYTPETHFQRITEQIGKGMDSADYKLVMSSAAALKRYKEENRGMGVQLALASGILCLGGIPTWIHKAGSTTKDSFYGRILEVDGHKITAKDLGKRETMKQISEQDQSACTITDLPTSAAVLVSR